MRRAAKRDTVEPAVVDLFRRAGWSVQHLSLPDAPDLLLGYGGHTFLAEVKTGTKRLRPGQAAWHAAWRGGPVYVIRAIQDAEALVLTAGPMLRGLFRAKAKVPPISVENRRNVVGSGIGLRLRRRPTP